MQSQFLNINDTFYQVLRKFRADNSYFPKAVEIYGGEEICKYYHAEKLLKDSNGNFYIVNEVSDANVIPEEAEVIKKKRGRPKKIKE